DVELRRGLAARQELAAADGQQVGQPVELRAEGAAPQQLLAERPLLRPDRLQVDAAPRLVGKPLQGATQAAALGVELAAQRLDALRQRRDAPLELAERFQGVVVQFGDAVGAVHLALVPRSRSARRLAAPGPRQPALALVPRRLIRFLNAWPRAWTDAV